MSESSTGYASEQDATARSQRNAETVPSTADSTEFDRQRLGSLRSVLGTGRIDRAGLVGEPDSRGIDAPDLGGHRPRISGRSRRPVGTFTDEVRLSPSTTRPAGASVAEIRRLEALGEALIDLARTCLASPTYLACA